MPSLKSEILKTLEYFLLIARLGAPRPTAPRLPPRPSPWYRGWGSRRRFLQRSPMARPRGRSRGRRRGRAGQPRITQQLLPQIKNPSSLKGENIKGGWGGERWKVGLGHWCGEWSACLMLKCMDACRYHHDAHGGARARGCGWRLAGGQAAGRPAPAQRGAELAPKKGRCLWRHSYSSSAARTERRRRPSLAARQQQAAPARRGAALAAGELGSRGGLRAVHGARERIFASLFGLTDSNTMSKNGNRQGIVLRR
jgi:hypothetical protein